MDIIKYIFIAIMATMLKVQTYYMKGLNNSDEYVRDIISQHQPDIICMQETWHLDNACEQFSKLDYQYFFVEQSGCDSAETILQGRASGGLAIMYRKDIAGNIVRVTTDSKRICAIHLKSKCGYKILLSSQFIWHLTTDVHVQLTQNSAILSSRLNK